ncbi:thrombospondin type 3 repeat-containing protein [uncultured Thiodictyon sp.]|uniref:thrombospondin type 3 repeat-containing protein n=1 Tax=uncultured Thiodictyon sp. TaxID=1846217 RepID=UPI0025D69EAA|nr:thrombospondin type 3 repeat-containing protein [uncultured Thiodictyon sp.]
MMQHTKTLLGALSALALLMSANLPAGTLIYQYDALNRLNGVNYPDGSKIAYSYDLAGNRLSQVVTVSWPDTDRDGIPDDTDNCPTSPNTDQANHDTDALGDACDPDDDNDGTPDTADAFPLDPTEQLDTDGDGIGNNADPDDDNDGVPDGSDNCPLVANPDQSDQNGDGIGDACDPTPTFCWSCLPNRGGWRAILK